MPVQQFSFTKPGQTPDQQRFNRERQLAQVMQQQAMTQDPTQMTGGYVIRQSALSPLVKVAQALASRKMAARADTGEQDYMRERSDAVARAIAEARRAGEGREALPAIEAPTEELGGGPGRPQMEARAPNPMRTYEALAGIDDPMVRQFGLQGMLSSMGPKAPIKLGKDDRLVDPTNYGTLVGAQQQPKITRVEIPDGKGGVRVGFVDMNSPNPMQTFQEAGAQPAKAEILPSGQVVNLYETQPGQVFNDPNKLMGIGPDGRPVVNQPLADVKGRIAERGAARTNVSVNAPSDNKYMDERRKNQATQFNDLEKAAQSAHNQIVALDRFLDASKKGLQGGAAPLISGAQNFLASFGYSSESLKNTRIMEQVVGDILQNKMSELGARGLTDRDMQILREALPRMAIDRASRESIAEIIKKSAAHTLAEYDNARKEEERVYPGFASKSPTPNWYRQYTQGAQSPPAAPSQGRGRVVVDY